MRIKNSLTSLPLLPLAAAVLMTLPARAQQPEPEPEPGTEVQKVVVSGLRAAEHATVQTKKATRQIVDAVSQDDIIRANNGAFIGVAEDY